jgi:drug/metabolite transporter superfamily protein YnfA
VSLAVFVVAAFFEIAGCFAFWLCAPWSNLFVVVLGLASLAGFALP